MDKIMDMYDKEFRQQLMSDPKKYYKKFNDVFLDDVEVIVKKNTKNISHIIMPSDSESIKRDIGNLGNIRGGFALGTTGSLGSVATASSLGSVCGTGSSFSCASTMGTAGTNAI